MRSLKLAWNCSPLLFVALVVQLPSPPQARRSVKQRVVNKDDLVSPEPQGIGIKLRVHPTGP